LSHYRFSFSSYVKQRAMYIPFTVNVISSVFTTGPMPLIVKDHHEMLTEGIIANPTARTVNEEDHPHLHRREGDIPRTLSKALPTTTPTTTTTAIRTTTTPLLASSQKRVSFASHCREKVHICRDDYSVHEKTMCWLTNDEYSIIRRRRRRSIESMLRGVTTTSDVCTRGLESKACYDAAEARADRIENAYEAVLDEQDIQHHQGRCDPERIASVYRDASSLESSLVAREWAIHDAVAAFSIHMEDALCTISLSVHTKQYEYLFNSE
jgi:hypothetical protein